MTRPFGEIITFYSYKGGTGRSMILANVGHLLSADRNHQDDRRVLLIDWDLEAPGLERFFPRPRRAGERVGPGLIDYLTDVAAHYQSMAPEGRLPESMAADPRAVEIHEAAKQAFPLNRYVRQVNERGNLWVMQAGARPTVDDAADNSYWSKVRAFDWDRFYHNYGSFFTHFRELLMAEYTYVLIDSRTGLTDIGGICTRVMPEKLVLVFAPNHQNIDGVLDVARKSIKYRSDSRDPRSLLVFPVASRIDASASMLRTAWRKGGSIRGESITGYQERFESLFTELYRLDQCDLGDYFDATQVPHDSDYAYGEAVAAAIDDTGDRFGIGYACDQLTRRLVQQAAPWEDATSPAVNGHKSIFISYRRTDSAAAGRLYDALSETLGRERVFMDVGPSGVGENWTIGIEATLAACAAVIVLIGKNWLASDGSPDQNRLHEPDDFVRAEIAVALRLGLRVVPVLLDGARMPTPTELPSDVEELAYRQAVSVRTTSWDRDVDRLAYALASIIGPLERSPDDSSTAPRSLWARLLAWLRGASSP